MALCVACFLFAWNEDFRSLSIQVAGSCAVATGTGGGVVSKAGAVRPPLRFIFPSSDVLSCLLAV